MELNEYQQKSRKTALYPNQGQLGGLVYTILGLAGEAGELANKIKKVLRDQNGVLSDATRVELIKELGDVGWYFSNIATELGTDLDSVAQKNLEKLLSRLERGQIHGSGDNR